VRDTSEEEYAGDA